MDAIVIKYFKKLSVFLGLLCIASGAYAQVHTWHTIKVNNGVWSASLKAINEEASFVRADGSPISTFSMNPNDPVIYGFQFDPKDDFDVAYTLTLTHQDTADFITKTCVFVITAKGPADPDIRTLEYYGAKCSWVVVPKVGEDFTAE